MKYNIARASHMLATHALHAKATLLIPIYIQINKKLHITLLCVSLFIDTECTW